MLPIPERAGKYPPTRFHFLATVFAFRADVPLQLKVCDCNNYGRLWGRNRH